MTAVELQHPDELSPSALADIERRTQAIGRFIFDRLRVEQPNILQRRWWDDRIMSWTMRDERLKVQMFRFIDALPMLRDDGDVVEHLSEYLQQAGDSVPWVMSTAVGLARRSSFVAGAIASAARISAQDYARRFIAGTNVREVVDAALRERQLKRAFTLDLLGEAVMSDVEAEHYLQAYLNLLANISPLVNAWPEVAQIDRNPAGILPRVNVSIKLSALDARFQAIDPEGSYRRAGRRLRELLREAGRQRAFVNVDMESYDKKDLTLQIFKRVLEEPEFRERDQIGVVIQCYLHDALRDLKALRDWAERRGTPIWVRLVKGAYWDYETIHAKSLGWPIPVFQKKWQSDHCFEAATQFVLANRRWLRPALGTHNIRSLAYGLAIAEHLELPPGTVELQMLYGMGDAVKQAVVERGERMRIYMPYGELLPGMSYLVRRLLENTSNDGFLRASFEEQVPPAILLQQPGRKPELGTEPAEPSAPVTDTGPTSSRGHLPLAQHRDFQEASSMTATEDPLAAEFSNEPPVDFAREANRRAMRAALEAVREQFGKHHPLVIGNVAVETPQRDASTNPADIGETIGTVARAEPTHVSQAVSAALAAGVDWARRPVEERAEFLYRAADALRQRRFELAAWIVFECGKPWSEATGDVDEAIDFCEYYADGAIRLQGLRGVDIPGEENRFEYLPRGVAAIIAPWNFPLAILTGMTVAALVTGNPAIMKPAEQSPIVAAKLMEIFQELGIPPGVLAFLPGPGETVGAALVADPNVAVIAFTGSRAVGLTINAQAAAVSAKAGKLVKRVIAEMGGKNAIVVDSDADLDEAVAGVVRSAFGYQGQKCSACSRVIVLDAVHDVFVKRLVEAAASLQIGLPEDPGTEVGPLIDAESAARVREYCELGRREGKQVLGGEVGDLATQGNFVAPHIFADVAPQSRLAQEEIFGPVLAVIRARDFDEAIRVANETDYALTGGLFSRSPARLERGRRELMVGNLYLNRGITGALVGRQPFGGFRLSGIGSKAGGPDYLLQFVVPRTVTENTMRRGFAPPE